MNTILNILKYSKLLNFGEEKNKVSFLFWKFFLVFVWKRTFSTGKEIISFFEFKRKKKKMFEKLLSFLLVQLKAIKCLWVLSKQWPLAPNLWKWQITCANVSRRVTFFSKMAFGECRRVWRVPAKVLGKCRQVWRVLAKSWPMIR